MINVRLMGSFCSLEKHLQMQKTSASLSSSSFCLGQTSEILFGILPVLYTDKKAPKNVSCDLRCRLLCEAFHMTCVRVVRLTWAPRVLWPRHEKCRKRYLVEREQEVHTVNSKNTHLSFGRVLWYRRKRRTRWMWVYVSFLSHDALFELKLLEELRQHNSRFQAENQPVCPSPEIRAFSVSKDLYVSIDGGRYSQWIASEPKYFFIFA